MTLPVWPDSLGFPKLDPYEVRMRRGFFESTVVGGPLRRRGADPDAPWLQTWSFVWTTEQSQTFDTFYRDTLSWGIKPFEGCIKTVHGIVNVDCNFSAEPLTYNLGDGYYQTTLAVWSTVPARFDPIYDIIDAGTAPNPSPIADVIDAGTAAAPAPIDDVIDAGALV